MDVDGGLLKGLRHRLQEHVVEVQDLLLRSVECSCRIELYLFSFKYKLIFANFSQEMLESHLAHVGADRELLEVERELEELDMGQEDLIFFRFQSQILHILIEPEESGLSQQLIHNVIVFDVDAEFLQSLESGNVGYVLSNEVPFSLTLVIQTDQLYSLQFGQDLIIPLDLISQFLQ